MTIRPWSDALAVVDGIPFELHTERHDTRRDSPSLLLHGGALRNDATLRPSIHSYDDR
jgi:hypothetical protein